MRLTAIATGLLVAFASVATAQGSSSNSGQKAQAPTGPGGERLICRRVEEIGSLARRPRRCYTRAQWDRLAEDSRNTGASANSGSTSGN